MGGVERSRKRVIRLIRRPCSPLHPTVRMPRTSCTAAEYTSDMDLSQTAQDAGEHHDVIVLAHGDDVAVALRDLRPGDVVSADGLTIRTAQSVGAGHKIALRSVGKGEPVTKYGFAIGRATTAIEPGEHVHSHNLSAAGLDLCSQARGEHPAPRRPQHTLGASMPTTATFEGYRRPGGRVGTRNSIAVVSTVNCSADAVHRMVASVRADALPAFRHVDAVAPITHQGGCGMPLGGPTHEILARCLSGIAAHPNVAGVLVVGLGCEVMQPEPILEAAADAGVPHRLISIQSSGGIGSAVRRGLDDLTALLQEADKGRRTTVPVADLLVGTECGGSDAYSGITANPLLGRAADMLISAGASWALGESPETSGAERLLIARAVDDAVGNRMRSVMSWWEEYTTRHGATVDNNPAPGNKAGGLTTIYEKALGAVAKGGSQPLRAVVGYAEPITGPGLTFMDTPGMDDVSVTGLVAGGCTLVAFTTGRGSCLAFGPAPVVKIAATTELFDRMPGDMDFDAGVLLRGAALDEVANRLAEKLIRVASGERTRGEEQGLGDHTFAPWDMGPTL